MQKFFTKLFLASLISISFSVFAGPADFDIGQQSPQITVTPKMMENIRIKAIANIDDLIADPYDVVAGNPIGTITMVQFVDFMCHVSSKMDPTIQALIKANPNLRVVYKPYPLRGTTSNEAAKSALIANQQGKYLGFHVALMQVGPKLTEEQILSIAKAQGLDVNLLKQDLSKKDYTEQVADARKLADKIGIVGTPSLFFAKTDLMKTANQNEIVYMLGDFNQSELQAAVNYIKTINKL